MGVRHGQHRKNLEFWNPKILCWEGVMFFYDLFIKSVIWVSKRLKWKNMEIWNLGILKSYFGEVSLFFTKHSQNRWSRARNSQHRKIFQSGIWQYQNLIFGRCGFIYKLFTKSVIWNSKRSKSKNLEIWNLKILFWEGVIVLHTLFIKSVIWGSKPSKSKKQNEI